MPAANYPFNTKTIEVKGTSYTFRELNVSENDDCNDIGNGPDGKWNGRAALRLMIVKSSVDPKLTPEDISSMPLSVYNAVAAAVNEVNSGETDGDETDPNA